MTHHSRIEQTKYLEVETTKMEAQQFPANNNFE
jgi:hypothetical protein